MRKNQTRKDQTANGQTQTLHPLLQEIVIRLEDAGKVVVAPDGHLFFEPDVTVKTRFGAMDMKKEGEKYGVRIIARKVRKRATKSKYKDMPWFQIYMLPIVKKNAKTMTDNERRNMELNRQALRMAHAVERDPEQVAAWRERHEAHKRNPEGYAKLYPNLFGFLVATFRKELEAQEMRDADAPLEVAHTEHRSASDEVRQQLPTITDNMCSSHQLPTIIDNYDNGIQSVGIRLAQRRNGRSFMPFIRLPMVV